MVLAEALQRLGAGDEGSAQEPGGYEGYFSDEDPWLDLGSQAAEVHRVVWAWRYAVPRGKVHGALVEHDGRTVRVLASSLTPANGPRIDCADGPLWLLDTGTRLKTLDCQRSGASTPWDTQRIALREFALPRQPESLPGRYE